MEDADESYRNAVKELSKVVRSMMYDVFTGVTPNTDTELVLLQSAMCNALWISIKRIASALPDEYREDLYKQMLNEPEKQIEFLAKEFKEWKDERKTWEPW